MKMKMRVEQLSQPQMSEDMASYADKHLKKVVECKRQIDDLCISAIKDYRKMLLDLKESLRIMRDIYRYR